MSAFSTIGDEPFADRKFRLEITGFVQIGIGALLALGCVAILFAYTMLTTVPEETLFLGFIFAFTASLSGWSITMGVGSIKARRWARALILAVSWILLARGVSTFSNGIFLDVMERSSSLTELPRAADAGMLFASIVFSALVHLGIPAALILVYRGKDVQATCERWNPEPCWTDRRPLSVLALCFALCISPLELLAFGLFGWIFPFYGEIVSGLPGLVACLALACVYLYLAWATWNLRRHAWVLSIAVCVLYGLSSAITYSTVDTAELYAAMNLPGEIVGLALETTESIPMKVASAFESVYSTAWIVALIFYTRRFYYPDEELEVAPGFD